MKPSPILRLYRMGFLRFGPRPFLRLRKIVGCFWNARSLCEQNHIDLFSTFVEISFHKLNFNISKSTRAYATTAPRAVLATTTDPSRTHCFIFGLVYRVRLFVNVNARRRRGAFSQNILDTRQKSFLLQISMSNTYLIGHLAALKGPTCTGTK